VHNAKVKKIYNHKKLNKTTCLADDSFESEGNRKELSVYEKEKLKMERKL